MHRGLEHGHVAMVTKVHHAAIDGVSGTELMVHLLDLEPEPAPIDATRRAEWEPDRVPTDVELLGYAARVARPPAAAGACKADAPHGETVLPSAAATASADVAPPPGFVRRAAARRSTARSRRTAGRVHVDVALDDVKAVKNAFGVTVNDVVLALCPARCATTSTSAASCPTGRWWPWCPMSVRTEDEKGTLGNQVSRHDSSSLATDIDDPVERLMAIHDAHQGRQGAAEGHRRRHAQDWAEFAAPAVAARAARLYSRMRLADRHRPVFNVTISNVPGPPFPLYSAGARLVAYYPWARSSTAAA